MVDKKKQAILKAAEESFLKFGYKKTNLSDVAKSVGVSKRTVYQYFPAKEILLKEAVENVKAEISSELKSVLKSRGNSAKKLFAIGEILGRRFQKMTDLFMEDIKTNLPEVWSDIENFRRDFIFKNITRLLEQGKREGMVIKKPTAILIAVIVASIEAVVHPEFIVNNSISAHEALETTLHIVISGILTARGRKVFKQIKKVKR